MDVIANLKELHIPVGSAGEAVRSIRTKYETAGKSQFEFLIKEVTGMDFVGKHLKESELMFGYCVQQSVHMHNNGFEHIKGAEVFPAAKLKTEKYLNENPWVVCASDAPVVEGEVQAPAPTTGKKRSGPSKKDQCIALFNQGENSTLNRKDLIAVFVKELGLTPAGASTYVHNVQKGLWK